MAGEFDVMNSPDFGAFGGARFNLEQNLGALKALHTAGEIQKQPAERASAEALARFRQAEAGKLEVDTAEQKKMGELIAGFGGGQEPSLASPLEAVAQLGFKAGLYKLPLQLAEKASLIRSHEATAESARASAILHQLDAQQRALEQQGSLAASAIDQSSYDRLRLMLTSQGKDISDLPEGFVAAKPMLDQVIMNSVKAKDQLDLQRKKVLDDSLMARRRAANSRDAASAAVSAARVPVLRERARILSKTDPSSAEATDARSALVDSRRARQAQIEAKLYPSLPKEALKDPAKRIVGQTYTLPTGRFTWSGQGWIAAPKSVRAATAPVGGSIDGDNEDD